jgi:SHS2 domain-containing protein
MQERRQGFREIEHTADWELEVWGPDMPALLEQAARGMNSLTSTRLEKGPRVNRELELRAVDRESMLVAFLQELLYIGEVEGLGFDRFEFRLSEETLFAGLEGRPIRSRSKEIKAVTYHNLVVRDTGQGLEASIVFDV